MIEAEVEFNVEFYDVDSMDVVWHGNYVKYLELGRVALLEKIRYDYNAMKESGYVFPVTSLKLKYIKPLVFRQKAVIKAALVEYENRLRINYIIYDKVTGEIATKAESIQMAVNMKTKTTMFECPECFIKKVREFE
mgnify:CR=1 FL=1